MAKEIIRDGIKYSVAHTFEFDKNGEISKSYDGGEITDSIVDSIIEHEKMNAQLEKQDRQFAKDDEEDRKNQLINTKKFKKGRKEHAR